MGLENLELIPLKFTDEVKAVVNFSASQSLLLFNSMLPFDEGFMNPGQNIT